MVDDLPTWEPKVAEIPEVELTFHAAVETQVGDSFDEGGVAQRRPLEAVASDLGWAGPTSSAVALLEELIGPTPLVVDVSDLPPDDNGTRPTTVIEVNYFLEWQHLVAIPEGLDTASDPSAHADVVLTGCAGLSWPRRHPIDPNGPPVIMVTCSGPHSLHSLDGAVHVPIFTWPGVNTLTAIGYAFRYRLAR